jgi:hypothetical protein
VVKRGCRLSATGSEAKRKATMSRTLSWSLKAALCVVSLTSQPVLADCNSLLANARMLVRDIAVTIDVPSSSPAETPLKNNVETDPDESRSAFVHCSDRTT